MAAKIGAISYIECSSLRKDGVRKVFEVLFSFMTHFRNVWRHNHWNSRQRREQRWVSDQGLAKRAQNVRLSRILDLGWKNQNFLLGNPILTRAVQVFQPKNEPDSVKPRSQLTPKGLFFKRESLFTESHFCLKRGPNSLVRCTSSNSTRMDWLPSVSSWTYNCSESLKNQHFSTLYTNCTLICNYSSYYCLYWRIMTS